MTNKRKNPAVKVTKTLSNTIDITTVSVEKLLQVHINSFRIVCTCKRTALFYGDVLSYASLALMMDVLQEMI